MDLLFIADLPPAQQVEVLTDLCNYLTDKYLCPCLFGNDTTDLGPETMLDLGTSVDASYIGDEFQDVT